MRTTHFIFIFIFCAGLGHAQVDTTSTYYFAHSLINHQKTTSNQANIPYWMAELEKAANNVCLTSGQYAPGQSGANALPPTQTWSFYYENDNHSSALKPNDAYIANAHDHVVLTYMNWEIIYDYGARIGERQTNTIAKATDSISRIFNWMRTNDPNANLFLYECWPKIETNFLLGGNSWTPNSGNPPDSAQWAAYMDYALSMSHDFWIELQDSLISKGEFSNLKLIPSSMICAKLWQPNGILNDFTVTDIFEDQGPHGLATSYFLAAMVVYAAQHGEAPTKPFDSHAQIDKRLLDRFESIASFIMSELASFNFSDNTSRVWFDESTTTKAIENNKNLTIYPNPSRNHFIINTGDYYKTTTHLAIVNVMGQTVYKNSISQQELRIDAKSLGGAGIYFVRIHDGQGVLKQVEKLVIE